MKIFKKAKFICSYAKCGVSLPLEKIHHHEMFKCPHRSILCSAQGCRFFNNVETVIIHSINCPFHLLYCAKCKSLYNVSVLIHDCNVIKFQRSIPSYFKYYHENSPINHSDKDVFLRTNSHIETFEDRGKINYDMFLSVFTLSISNYLCSHYEFYDAKMELKIYHYLILIQTNITFSLLFFSYCHLLIHIKIKYKNKSRNC